MLKKVLALLLCLSLVVAFGCVSASAAVFHASDGTVVNYYLTNNNKNTSEAYLRGDIGLSKNTTGGQVKVVVTAYKTSGGYLQNQATSYGTSAGCNQGYDYKNFSYGYGSYYANSCSFTGNLTVY